MSLWTKVRGAVVGMAAPIVGGFLGGPAGAQIGAKLGASYASTQRASLINGTGPPMVTPPGGGGDGGMVPVGSSGTWGGGVRNWVVGARGVVRNALGRIIGVMQGSKLLRTPTIMRIVRQMGMIGAIAALGILAAEMAEIVIGETSKRRRRVRGITGRDIRCTRRTLGKIRSVQRMIGIPATRRTSSRSTSGRGTVVCT